MGLHRQQRPFVIKPQWDHASVFSEGLASVCLGRDKKCGLIDKTGKLVTALEWDFIWPFSENLAPVEQEGKWGFADKSGKVVIEPQWDNASENGFQNGLARVSRRRNDPDRNDRWGCIDKSGKVIIEPQFEDMSDFLGGLAQVIRNGKCGLIDRTGRMITSPQWDTCTPYRESDDGNAAVYWFVAGVLADKAEQPMFTGPHIIVKWLDSTGKEIWSFEHSKPSP
jgi:hypothetical protein